MKVEVTLITPDNAPAQLTIFATVGELKAIAVSLDTWNVPVGLLKIAIASAVEDATRRYQGLPDQESRS
jgi:hypothetical protein